MKTIPEIKALINYEFKYHFASNVILITIGVFALFALLIAGEAYRQSVMFPPRLLQLITIVNGVGVVVLIQWRNADMIREGENSR